MDGSVKICVLSMAVALWVSSCSASRLPTGDAGRERLGGCPSRPNCVSSEATDAGHAIRPLHLKGDISDRMGRDHGNRRPAAAQ